MLGFDKKNSEKRECVWETDYEICGGLRKLKGERDFIPFRQLGQYEDEETGLYYNRFRYYNSEMGSYISQDPLDWKEITPTFMLTYMTQTTNLTRLAWILALLLLIQKG